jgi:cytochrome P450
MHPVPETPGGTAQPRDVVGYTEVREAWRCPHLSSDVGGAGAQFFHKDTVVRVDGRAHAQRRRAMGSLLKQRGHKQFRDTALIPTARVMLDEVLRAPDADGYARMNLIQWGLRVNFRLGAAMVGFDEGRAGANADRLVELMFRLRRGRPSNISVATGRFEAADPVLQDAISARDEILASYYAPALERRRATLARIETGEAAETDLPLDLLSLIARRADPAWDDPAVAEREALFLFNAGVHTTTVSLYWTLRELFPWLQAHAEDAARLDDDAFLLRAAEEGMRLHPVTGGFARRATQDVRLSTGAEFAAGDLVLIRSGVANVDADAFGSTGLEYNPHRELPPGSQGYGYAFGSGPHLCFGLPIVMGAQGVDGSLVYLLRQLLKAGLQPDPDGPEQPPETSARGTYVPEPQVYAVRFPVSAG